MSRRSLAAIAIALAVSLLAVGAVRASTAPAVPEPPVLHSPTRAGTGQSVPVAIGEGGAHAADGDIGDWRGEPTLFGGTSVYSRGEYVYTDHIFDAYGADDGTDAQRLATLDPLAEQVPQTSRLDGFQQADIPGEFGVPDPTGAVSADERYGDLPHQDGADLVEVRLAASPGTLHLLARTTTMKDAPQSSATALLLLADTKAGPSEPTEVPFGSRLRTATADVAVLVAGGKAQAVELGSSTPFTPVGRAAWNPAGWVNAVEVDLPRALLAPPGGTSLKLAVVAGTFNTTTGQFANLANAAFRFGEPARVWMEKRQALSLHAQTVDPFLAPIDLGKLDAGVTERFVPGPGYHDRIFRSSEQISTEGGQDGVWQHYGAYVPAGNDPAKPAPATFWMHWRGGKAHSAAALTPNVFRDNGDSRGGFVFSPRGRGTATWYLGEGHVDFREVWDDALRTFAVDRDRVFVTGHSMGGWASYLLSVLYPDRFAGAYPVEGPVTQGAFTGVDFEGCDSHSTGGYSPCYVQTNNGDARTQHTLKLLDNLRNVPIAIYQGTIDELVPQSGTAVQVKRLHDLGYRYRYFQFPTYEHYTHPVVDEWMGGVEYLRTARRDPSPPRVTYVRDMPFERTVERGPDLRPDRQVQGLQFDFDAAYWMRGLTPADEVNGRARFDGRSLAITGAPTLAVPEAPTGPSMLGQTGPYVTNGQQWLTLPGAAAPPPQNRFEIDLRGAAAVTLDLAGMKLSLPGLTGSVVTDTPLRLTLVTPAGGAVVRDVPAGTTELQF